MQKLDTPATMRRFFENLYTFKWGNETLITSDEVSFMQEITKGEFDDMIVLSKFDNKAWILELGRITHIVYKNVVVASEYRINEKRHTRYAIDPAFFHDSWIETP